MPNKKAALNNIDAAHFVSLSFIYLLSCSFFPISKSEYFLQ
jgi:hypothetical protein